MRQQEAFAKSSYLKGTNLFDIRRHLADSHRGRATATEMKQMQGSAFFPRLAPSHLSLNSLHPLISVVARTKRLIQAAQRRKEEDYVWLVVSLLGWLAR